MSWFTDLASKAEAMLVKLDQDTAQALQNTNLQISTAKSGEPDDSENSKTYHKHRDELYKEQADDSTVRCAVGQTSAMPYNENQFDTGMANRIDNVQGTDCISHDKIADYSYSEPSATDTSLVDSEAKPLITNEQELRNSHTLQTVESPSNLSTQHSTFRLETSKLKPNLSKGQSKQTSKEINGRTKSSKSNAQIISLGADDIRASINKSLQEYSLALSRDRPTSHRTEPTSYSSHFDDQPRLIKHSVADDDDQFGRLHSSPSFSIDVPDDQATDITSRILKQGPLNKRTPFNLHKVINKLASHRGHSHSLLGDKTKIRLRRAQMRAASYLRRMNYYFQAYPTMKYWMIGYLVILQILVVYVLFFYQSSGSSSYLAEQVKHQQVDMSEELQSPKK